MTSLLLNAVDNEGGAARAAYRLHKGLQSIGADSKMLVGRKTTDDSKVVEAFSGWHPFASFRPLLNKIPLLLYPNRKSINFSPSFLPDSLAEKISSYDAQVINLHWINDGFLGIESLRKIRKPLVWTLHDMWAFTGGCHYNDGCEKYKETCGSCPQLGSNKEADLSRRTLHHKKKSWQDIDLTIVTPSKWLAECAGSSSLFKGKRVHVIPNGLDIEIYKPSSKSLAREKLSLPVDKKLILFGGMNASSDRRKGFQYLEPALKKIAKGPFSETLELVTFGSTGPVKRQDNGLKINDAGPMYDDRSLALLYSAADVFIAPSIQDNLPNTVMESLACATPVVAFNIGGMPDMIDHKKNGYLARPFETDDLGYGIEWILEDMERNIKLGEAAREKVLREYSLEIQASRYLNLYEGLLQNV